MWLPPSLRIHLQFNVRLGEDKRLATTINHLSSSDLSDYTETEHATTTRESEREANIMKPENLNISLCDRGSDIHAPHGDNIDTKTRSRAVCASCRAASLGLWTDLVSLQTLVCLLHCAHGSL